MLVQILEEHAAKMVGRRLIQCTLKGLLTLGSLKPPSQVMDHLPSVSAG
jgi:hypothetical protein